MLSVCEHDPGEGVSLTATLMKTVSLLEDVNKGDVRLQSSCWAAARPCEMDTCVL